MTIILQQFTVIHHFLLAFALIMEVPMMMILLSRTLKYRLNRLLNMVFGLVLILIQAGSLGVGGVTLHYVFFSEIEIFICLVIVITAARWRPEHV